MSKVVSLGYLDTPVEGVATLTHPRAVLNFDTDFRVKSEAVGKEVVLTNLTSPIDRPEKIRFGHAEIANIYNGSGIDPSVAAPTKKGVSVLIQVTNIMSVTDSADPSYRVDLPISAQLILKVPSSEYITGDVVQAQVGRLLSGLFDTGSITAARLESILRGSLVPSDL